MVYFLAIVAVILTPFAALIYFFWVRDRWDKEPWGLIWFLLFMGSVSVIPAIYIESALTGFSTSFSIQSLGELFFMAFVVAGLVEEIIKFSFVYIFTLRSSFFTEEYDGIYYSVAVALGFSFVENLVYVIFGSMSGGSAMGTAVMRAITAVPIHTACGVIIGYHIGFARFNASGMRKTNYILKGLVIAVVFHGIYDMFAFLPILYNLEYIGWTVLGIGITLYVVWAYCVYLIRLATIHSAERLGIDLREVKVNLMVEETVFKPVEREHDSYRKCGFCGKIIYNPMAKYCAGCGARLISGYNRSDGTDSR